VIFSRGRRGFAVMRDFGGEGDLDDEHKLDKDLR
jgi:hypothetical protein